MRDLSKILKVLSDESRLRALNLVQQRECCVCEVMQVMEISQSKASRILSALYDVGILKLRREGRWAHYSVATDNMPEYLKALLEGIKEYLNTDQVSVKDLESFKNTERAGSACVDDECKCSPIPVEG
jgi:ArsR family transcriptional regulator, arsenate/arsenite/antimonite-responsive transcriptional repressor